MWFRALIVLTAFSALAADQPLAQIELKDVVCVAMNSKGLVVACATRDKCVHLWDVEKKHVAALAEQCGEEPFTIAISPDDKWLAIGTFGNWNNEVDIWDLKATKIVHRIKAKWRGVYQVAFTPDSKEVVVGGFLQDRLSALVFDISTGKETTSFRTVTYDACAPVAVSPDGKLIATSGEDGTVQVREMKTGKSVYDKRETACVLLRFSEDGRTLVGGSAGDDELYLWTVKNWTKRIQKTKVGFGYRGALSPNGRYAMGDNHGGTYSALVAVETGEIAFQWSLPKDESVSSSAFSGDSKRFTIAGDKGTLTAWIIDSVIPERK